MADDTGCDISAELGPVDVVQVPGGLEHGTVRRLGDVQVTHHRGLVRLWRTNKDREVAPDLCGMPGPTCDRIGQWNLQQPEKGRTAADQELCQ